MDLNWMWKAILIVFVGSILLRIAGRKSISQLTVAQTVIMISIGTLMIQPVSERSIWVTFLIAGLLVLTLIFIEWMELKFDFIERLITGKSKVVIENGQLNKENMRRMRLTVDKLEVRLRQSNIANISDVQWATLEPNGQLGYMLKSNKQPATKEDLQMLIQLIENKLPYPQSNPIPQVIQPPNPENIFNEVKYKEHVDEEPEHLK